MVDHGASPQDMETHLRPLAQHPWSEIGFVGRCFPNSAESLGEFWGNAGKSGECQGDSTWLTTL